MHVVELLNPKTAENNAEKMLDWTKRLLRQLKKNGKDISFWPEASAGIAKFLHDQGCTSIVEVDEQGNEVRRAPQNGKRL